MSTYNRVTLMGNLTRDLELRQTPKGTYVTELPLALNRSRLTENGDREEETTFVNVVVWGKTAETAATYLEKGRSVLVEGRLQVHSWEDQETGEKRNRLEVVAETVHFVNGSSKSSTNQAKSREEPQNRPAGRKTDQRYARNRNSYQGRQHRAG